MENLNNPQPGDLEDPPDDEKPDEPEEEQEPEEPEDYDDEPLREQNEVEEGPPDSSH